MIANHQVLAVDCLNWLKNNLEEEIHLSFFDPPFNQGKAYRRAQDDLPEAQYWQWIQDIIAAIYEKTETGGAIYFMQREKNAERVLRVLRKSGWCFQNLIVWKKKTSAVPSTVRYGKQYQIIAYATKGKKPRVFNRLRISPPLPPGYKYERENGIYVTDIWDDIRELTSGYFAGNEAIRSENGDRFHKQQAPLALLLRIILSSTQVGDTVLDPFAGTGTTSVVATQLNRNAIAIDIDPENTKCIQNRLQSLRTTDEIKKYYEQYAHTENLAAIWG
ncbi:MAG: site-specific DNA-methyltransferase [Cyanobacteriota bacterium]|nr:site-specific DNA-methyltransferase [Cyanobacteriota bacterium]